MKGYKRVTYYEPRLGKNVVDMTHFSELTGENYFAEMRRLDSDTPTCLPTEFLTGPIVERLADLENRMEEGKLVSAKVENVDELDDVELQFYAGYNYGVRKNEAWLLLKLIANLVQDDDMVPMAGINLLMKRLYGFTYLNPKAKYIYTDDRGVKHRCTIMEQQEDWVSIDMEDGGIITVMKCEVKEDVTV